MSNATLIKQVDALLPQTQCTKCGFNGCLPYAQAIVNHETTINRCSPGGEQTIDTLAALLQQKVIPPAADILPTLPHTSAFIDEEACIGCALCLKACPVDAIIGSRKMMHTVINDWCTGCELCIPRCPVDCIRLISKPLPATEPRAEENRERYQQHQERFAPKTSATTPTNKQEMLQAAIERAKNKLASL